ncbi:MAG: alcohol dehydrogenase catalytic domain-containing protein [Desulfobacterales bacterium]|nr:MAG: alcohol dehydrogenase catalytic domain-containing protein [Desulfobacterales bacterium]
MSHPEISVVIRTFNEEKFLPALLDALSRQSLRDFETIVVDSGSMDRTRQIAAQKADKLLRIQSHDFTFGHSLNVGIRSATGRYIAIVSAHTLPVDSEWLAKLIEPFHDNQTAMVYGRQRGGEDSKFSEIQDMRRTFGSKHEVLRPPRFFANNANSAIRSDLWQQHPFDESLPGLEDIEWAKYWMELGYQVIYEPQAALYHIHEENWRQVRRRYHREAMAARWIGIKNLKHALFTPVIEAIRTLFDLGYGLSPFNKSRGKARKFLDLVREVTLFRTNKTMGTVKGLLDGKGIEDSVARQNFFFDRTCKAVVIHGPGRASLDEVKVPEVNPGDVLIRVAYESICATDLEIFDGTLGYYKNGMAKYPIIPGHEFSGRAVAFGPNVKHLQDGDSVVVECIQSCGVCPECKRDNWIACQSRTELGVIGRNGGYSEFVVVPGRFVHRLPSGFDLRKASLCEPMAVVLKGVRRLEHTWQTTSDSKRCAVVGAGPLGNLCAQTLALKGHHVTVFDRNPLRLGYFSDSNLSVLDDLKQLSEFEVLVEVTGDPDALEVMLHKSPAGATILLLGLPYAHRQFTFENIVAYDKTVVGSVGSSAKDFEDAIAFVPQLETTAFTEKILPLSDFKHAWELARTHKYLKLILKIS